jgi:predicted ATPase
MEDARAAVNEALTLINETEERVWEPEIHRLHGDLYLQESTADAEKHFQRALTQSREQHALSNELRAAMSLAKLWHSQEKTQEARELLQSVYADFTEGFDTADLIQAKELLSDLK